MRIRIRHWCALLFAFLEQRRSPNRKHVRTGRLAQFCKVRGLERLRGAQAMIRNAVLKTHFLARSPHSIPYPKTRVKDCRTECYPAAAARMLLRENAR
jgi:hypothetical protein